MWAVSVWGGYSFADVHDAGVAFSIVKDGEPVIAEAALTTLVERAWALRQEGLPPEHDLDEVLRRIAPVELGPVLLVEPADRTRGPCASDPRLLPYHRVRRPIFPLDSLEALR